MDTNSFMSSFSRKKCLSNDTKHFSKSLDFSELDPSDEFYSKVLEKVTGKRKLESAQDFELDEAVFSRSCILH